MRNTIEITDMNGEAQTLRLYNKFNKQNLDAPEAKRILDLKTTAEDGAKSVLILAKLKMEEPERYEPGWNISEIRCRESAQDLRKAFAKAGLEVPPSFVPVRVRLKVAAKLVSRKPD